MRYKQKIILIVAAFILLVSHFSFLFAYMFKPGKLSFFYCYPYFHQDWNLFVPPPESNYRLYAFYQDKGLQRIDLFKEISLQHQKNRFRGKEPLLVALSNSIHYLEAESDPAALQNNFKLVKKFAVNYLQETRKIHVNHLRLILVIQENNGLQKVYPI